MASSNLPLLPIRDTVMFPHMVTPLFVGRDRSVKAVEAATVHDDTIIVVSQRDSDIIEPEMDDLYPRGNRGLDRPGAANARRHDEHPGAGQAPRSHPRVHSGRSRTSGSRSSAVEEPQEISLPTEALMRAVLALFEKCVQLSRRLPDDAYVAAMNVDEPGWLADLVTSVLELPVDKRQEVLETLRSDDAAAAAEHLAGPGAGRAGAGSAHPQPGAEGSRQDSARVFPARADEGDSDRAGRVGRR